MPGKRIKPIYPMLILMALGVPALIGSCVATLLEEFRLWDSTRGLPRWSETYKIISEHMVAWRNGYAALTICLLIFELVAGFFCIKWYRQNNRLRKPCPRCGRNIPYFIQRNCPKCGRPIDS